MFLLYMDDDIEIVAVARALRAAGLDVLRSTDAGMRGADDEAHLDYARRMGGVLNTANRGDFARLNTSFAERGLLHGGIIIRANHHIGIGSQVRQILELAARVDAEAMRGQVFWIHRDSPDA